MPTVEDYPTSVAATLQKPKREGFSKIKAETFKPTDQKFDEENPAATEFYLVYVSGGNQFTVPTTQALWKRVTGKPQQEGRPLEGYHFKHRHTFVVLREKQHPKRAMYVDIIPEITKLAHGTKPGDQISDKGEMLEEKKTVNIRVLRDGSLEVLQVPYGVTDKRVYALMDALDRLDRVSAGDLVANKYEVKDIRGNVIFIDPMPYEAPE